MARPKQYVDEDLLKKLAAIALNPDEIAFTMGLSIDDLIPYKKLIEKHWPSDDEFRKIRLRRYRRATGEPFYNAKVLTKLRLSLKTQIADMLLRERGTVEELIGYPLLDLVLDFEKKFKPGMTWDNHGEWQIDHIKPRRLFNSRQLKKCFDPKNLRPLWAKENASKGSKWDGQE